MSKTAGITVLHCITFGWLVFLSVPTDPGPLVGQPRTGLEEDVASSQEVRELRERIQTLEAMLAAPQASRAHVELVEPVASTALNPVDHPARPADERDLELRAQVPVDWMSLERFVGQWSDKSDPASERTLALLGPSDLVRRFGPPTHVHHNGDSLAWIYESPERNAAGEPLTWVRFLVCNGCVIVVRRGENP